MNQNHTVETTLSDNCSNDEKFHSDDDSEISSVKLDSISDSKPSSKKILFPEKLHDMLEEAEHQGQSSIVSWLADGKSFKIHNPQEFSNKILPLYFKTKKLRSFKRQLNLYGFKKIGKGNDKDKAGSYIHKTFFRNRKDLFQHMKAARPNVTKKTLSKKDVQDQRKNDSELTKSKKRPHYDEIPFFLSDEYLYLMVKRDEANERLKALN